jgi:hypothetical protein
MPSSNVDLSHEGQAAVSGRLDPVMKTSASPESRTPPIVHSFLSVMISSQNDEQKIVSRLLNIQQNENR